MELVSYQDCVRMKSIYLGFSGIIKKYYFDCMLIIEFFSFDLITILWNPCINKQGKSNREGQYLPEENWPKALSRKFPRRNLNNQ